VQIEVLEKPRRGMPCNGCGHCCTVQPCKLAVEFLSCTSGPCVALEHEEGRTYCGLVRRPAYYMFKEDVPTDQTAQVSVLFASALGLGAGCDSDDNDE
jgi:hypothetical protein